MEDYVIFSMSFRVFVSIKLDCLEKTDLRTLNGFMFLCKTVEKMSIYVYLQDDL